MKELIFSILQLVLSILLIIVILLQQKGSGLSGLLGGSSNVYSTKRGVDKILHFSTIIIAFLFFSTSFSHLLF
jgi:preprotein translocase subunit SecG